MSESKIETTMGMCVVALTRHIMESQQLNYEDAYKTVLTSEFFQLLKDEETRLFLEPNNFLCSAYDIEFEYGKDALYDFINH